MTMHVWSPGKARTVYSSIYKDILVIFRDMDAYSVTLSREERGGLLCGF